MSAQVRPASLQDGVSVLALLEDVGYYPEPISFAKTYRKTLADPHFLVRVAELDDHIVGVATLSLRYELGLGGLLACLDELAVAPGAPKGVERALRQATLGRARALGAVCVPKERTSTRLPPAPRTCGRAPRPPRRPPPPCPAAPEERGATGNPAPMAAKDSFFLRGPAGRLEALLVHPRTPPVAAAVVCHAHPLYGGMMHFKVVFRADHQVAQLDLQRRRAAEQGHPLRPGPA